MKRTRTYSLLMCYFFLFPVSVPRDQGLSDEAIVGIVLGVVFLLLIIVLIIIIIFRRKRRHKGDIPGFDEIPYDNVTGDVKGVYPMQYRKTYYYSNEGDYDNVRTEDKQKNDENNGNVATTNDDYETLKQVTTTNDDETPKEDTASLSCVQIAES